MKPRITVTTVSSEDGKADEVRIWANAEGRRLLIAELQKLSETDDHFHMFTEDWGSDELSNRPYEPEEHVVHHLKVLFRTDEWDRQYFPHVMAE